MKTMRLLLSVCGFIALGLGSICWAAGTTTVSVRADYLNELKSPGENPPVTNASSATVFGGHVGLYSAPAPLLGDQVLSFDGVDDYGQTQQDMDLANRSFTLEAWAQRRSSDTMDMILGQGGAGSHRSLHFGFHIYAGNQFVLGFYDNDLFSGTSYTDDAWHHWAGTYDAATRLRCLYRDGILIATNTAPEHYQGAGSLYVGMTPFGGFGDLFDGQIDEVRIWGVARSQEEIRANMWRPLAGTEPDLLAYWPLNEGTGNTTADASGHGFTASFVNGPTWFPGPPAVPGDGTCQLTESSFGQAVSRDSPLPNFAVSAALAAQSLLYAPIGTSREVLRFGPYPDGKPWAFRYRRLLYDTNAVASDMEGEWFGAAERPQADAALALLRGALFYAPGDRNLRHTYLDLAYDIGVAELQGVKNDLNQLARYRIDPASLPAGTPVINAEITTYSNALVRLDRALANYGQLLSDPSGVALSDIDATAEPGTPFGYFVFQQEQPFRNQFAAEFLDANGVVRTVPDLDEQTGQPLEPGTEPRVLASGYKDYVFVITLLRDLVQHGTELARLYGTRAQPQDVQAGYGLITNLQQQVSADLEILEGMFPVGRFPAGDPTGVRTALNGVQLALADLSHVRTFLDGEANPLGIDPKFLVLVKESLVGSSGNEDIPFDSYDALNYYLDSSSTAPLAVARDAFEEARTSYDNYRAKADTVDQELSAIDDTYAQRHDEITGYHPNDPDFEQFNGTNPKPSSELAKSQQIVTNLLQRLSVLGELDRMMESQLAAAQLQVQVATNKDLAIEQAVEMYASRIAGPYDTLTEWRMASAATQAAAEGAYAAGGGNPAAIWCGVVGGVVNTAVQTTSAYFTTQAERDLDIASAKFEAELTQVDVELNIIQARNNYDALIREQMSSGMEVQAVQAQINQEIAQQAGLQRELERMRQNRAANAVGIRNRYYADPVHFLRSRSAMLRAEQAFRRAQRWVFLTQRALEYKWNDLFSYTYPAGGLAFDRHSVFRARNYQELLDVAAALRDFNGDKLTAGFNRDWRKDRISLRDDVLTKPNEGSLAARKARFRQYLKGELTSPYVSRQAGYLVLKLNTFTLNKSAGTFFTGPQYDANGTMRDPGKWLDKIDWLKFNVVTANPSSEHTTAAFRYGGTCYIRAETPPCFAGNSLPGAYTAFPFQFYFKSGAEWTSLTSQEDQVSLYYSASSSEPPGTEAESGFLKERCVAATDLRLTILLTRLNLDEIEDIEIWVRHFVASTIPNLNCYEP